MPIEKDVGAFRLFCEGLDDELKALQRTYASGVLDIVYDAGGTLLVCPHQSAYDDIHTVMTDALSREGLHIFEPEDDRPQWDVGIHDEIFYERLGLVRGQEPDDIFLQALGHVADQLRCWSEEPERPLDFGVDVAATIEAVKERFAETPSPVDKIQHIRIALAWCTRWAINELKTSLATGGVDA